MKITAKAFAKLNLTLDICKKRDDGYHDIESVFQSIGLHDVISVKTTDNGISITDDIGINETDNICYKAAELFFEKSGISGGAEITITKSIPLAAGLGGGSADAGATLKALNYIYNKPLDGDTVMRLAAKLGADVPFCILGGTAEVKGIGEILRPVKPLPDCDIVIIKEGKKPSTAKLYQMLDSTEIVARPDTKKVLKLLEAGDLKGISTELKNVFEPLWGNSLDTVKADLLGYGAISAVLSGSGPSIFGIFKKGEGENAYNSLKEKYQNIYLTAPNPESGVRLTRAEPDFGVQF